METEKQALRREIAREKKTHTEAQLGAWSDEICRAVERREAFRRARCVACYHALPGEVQTEAFLNRWCGAKRMLLPRVEGDDLRLYPYTGPESVRRGAYGIWEPVAEGDPVPFEAVDLVIVPGVAFDREGNRLGRGRGFYDRLLATCGAVKIGICFAFQLRDRVPAGPTDVPMDEVISNLIG